MSGNRTPGATATGFDQLNPSQQQAVLAPLDKPSLVLAGPGTGKTKTLVERWIHLTRQGVRPARIMTSTFSRDAAKEMRERIQLASGIPTDKLPITTLHSAALSLLRQSAGLHGVPAKVQVADEAMSRGILYDLKIFAREDDDVLDHFSRWKDRLVTPEMAIQEAEKAGDARAEEIARHYAAYQAELAKRGLFDFGDLILEAVKALEGSERLREQWQGRYDHLLFDEYQDINPAQDRLINCLWTPGKGLWVVGDDDQCIYAFRSADSNFILDFAARYGEAIGEEVDVFRLDRNYRCSPSIMSAASAVIANNERRLPKQIVATREYDNGVFLHGFDNAHDEARFVARQIRMLLDGGFKPQQIAVLMRAGFVAVYMQAAMQKEGIPVSIKGAADFWGSAEIKAALGALRLSVDPKDTAAGGLCPAGKRGDTLKKTAADLADEKDLTWAQRVTAIKRALEAIPPRVGGEERRIQWDEGVAAACRIALDLGNLDAFLREVQTQQKKEKVDESEAVPLSTIHGAKGLEWDTVFVVGVEDQLLPHKRAEDLEEERRLFYVALTRAIRHAWVTYSLERGEDTTSASRFITEMLPGLEPGKLTASGRAKDMMVELMAARRQARADYPGEDRPAATTQRQATQGRSVQATPPQGAGRPPPDFPVQDEIEAMIRRDPAPQPTVRAPRSGGFSGMRGDPQASRPATDVARIHADRAPPPPTIDLPASRESSILTVPGAPAKVSKPEALQRYLDGLRKSPAGGQPWDEQANEFLRQGFRRRPVADIARQLGRSEASVAYRLLGLNMIDEAECQLMLRNIEQTATPAPTA